MTKKKNTAGEGGAQYIQHECTSQDTTGRPESASVPSLPPLVLSDTERIRDTLRTIAQRVPDKIADKTELGRLNKKYRVPVKDLQEELNRLRAEIAEARIAPPAPPTPEQVAAAEERRVEAKQNTARKAAEEAEIEEAAEALAHSQNLFENWARDFALTGYIADAVLGATLLVMLVSRLRSHPTGFMFVGESGSGKSDAILSAVKFIPPEYVLHLTSVSEKALYYMGDVGAKLLLFGEMQPTRPGEDDFRQCALRQLISEGKLTRGIAESDGQSVSFELKETTNAGSVVASSVHGPSKWDHQTVTRFSWTHTDSTRSATAAVLAKRAARAERPWERNEQLDKRIRVWQVFHQRLTPRAVQIPYAQIIIPSDEHVAARRLQGLLHAMIECSALVHQYSRETVSGTDGVEYLVASIQDYDVAYELLGRNAPRTNESCGDAALSAYQAIKPHLLGRDPYGEPKYLHLAQIRSILKKPKETVRGWVDDLCEAGLLEHDGKWGRQYKFILGPAEVDPSQSLGLVSPGAVRAKMTGLSVSAEEPEPQRLSDIQLHLGLIGSSRSSTERPAASSATGTRSNNPPIRDSERQTERPTEDDDTPPPLVEEVY